MYWFTVSELAQLSDKPIHCEGMSQPKVYLFNKEKQKAAAAFTCGV